MASEIKGQSEAIPQLQAGRRAQQRLRTRLSATLETTSRRYAVTMRNISVGGALIEAPELPPIGRTVALRRNTIDVLATVVWTEPGLCGLEFLEPISEAQVLHHLQAAPEPSMEATRDYFWRMREGSDRLSPGEWESMRASMYRSGLVSKN